MRQTVILGAGLSGLACAHKLGRDYRIFESETVVGGTARSFKRQNFSFDCTGHWLHLRDAEVRDLVHSLLGNELLSIERRSAIFSHGVYTPYPFQAHTHGLPAAVIADCLLGYFQAREKTARGEYQTPRHFDDFIRQKMGAGIAEHFMIPYNTKLWTLAPTQMDYTWCERFVPTPTPEEVVYGALTPQGTGAPLGYNANFLYPREGGIGRLALALEASLTVPVQTGIAATRMDLGRRQLSFSDATTLSFSHLVSTLPLKYLIALITDAPENVKQAAQNLRHTSVTYWDLGFTGANKAGDPHWIYFPEADFPFYRIGSASAALATLAPAGHRSYYVEVAHASDTAAPVSDDEILQGMRKARLIADHEEPILSHKTTLPCAYVIMDHNYGAARKLLLDWLASQGVFSVGRYGAWIYDSMEGALRQGLDTAAAILKETV